jgi:hypothetical protein
MKAVRAVAGCVAALAVVVACAQVPAQVPLTRTGQLVVAGQTREFVVRHLPISSFPELPARVAAELLRRGCMIPQTWEAHRPENVVRASLEQPGSQDWAVLCSVDGNVALLVFLASGGEPVLLARAPETERLRQTGLGNTMGFDWGIDPATPEQVHQAQAGLEPRPARLDHDALADSSIERKTIYHFFNHGAWTVLALPE